MDLYRVRRFFRHWGLWTIMGIATLIGAGVLLRPTDPVGFMPQGGARSPAGTVVPLAAGPGAALRPSVTLPPFSQPDALTMPVELGLTPEEQGALRLVEWLPLTSTLAIQHDSSQAAALITTFNQLRAEAGMPVLIADEDLARRAGAMAQSRLAFRLYDEDGAVFRRHQAAWLASFGVTDGGVLSVDVLPLGASIITAGGNHSQLAALLRDGAYGPLTSARYSHVGIGVGRVDGWTTGGTLVVLFY